jgi:hypothetical protein
MEFKKRKISVEIPYEIMEIVFSYLLPTERVDIEQHELIALLTTLRLINKVSRNINWKRLLRFHKFIFPIHKFPLLEHSNVNIWTKIELCFIGKGGYTEKQERWIGKNFKFLQDGYELHGSITSEQCPKHIWKCFKYFKYLTTSSSLEQSILSSELSDCLVGLREVYSIRFNNSYVTDDIIKILCRKTKLKHISLNNCPHITIELVNFIREETDFNICYDAGFYYIYARRNIID